MKFIGLTGSIATGKSTVASMFEKLGCYIINADKLAHDVYSKGSDGYFEVLEKFGRSILDENGNIDRKKLGNLVLSDRWKLRELESIVHPLVEKKRKEILSQIKNKDKDAIVLYDVPLLFEKKMQDMFDCVLVVWVDLSTQIKRLMSRDKIGETEAKRKISLQISVDVKRSLADIVIDNSKSLDYTYNQVKDVFLKIKKGEIC